ncbi:MAG TPA: hypothetical protein VEE86_04085 [Thermoplasmata archaeon]|nr:hypothetical protein [Thermoplasmata archaeon]
MSGARVYRSTYHRPAAPPPNRAAENAPQRSHAAIPVAIVLVMLGLYLSQFTLLLTALVGVVLFLSGASFLSTRLNPLSPHFYLTRKPSWLAIGVVFLSAFGLLAVAYWMFVHGLAPVVPRL